MRMVLSFLCLGMALLSQAQVDEKSIDNWFVIKDNRIKPVTSMTDQSLVNLNLTDFTDSDTIKLCHGSPIDVWINNKLYFRELPRGCDKFRVFDLREQVGMDSLILSVSYDRYTQLSASLLVSSNHSDNLAIPRDKNLDSLTEFYLQALLIILMVAAALKYAFPAKFAWVLSNPLASRSASDIEEFYKGFWHIENLITTLIFALIAAVQIIYIHHELSIWPYLNTWGNQYFSQWLFISGIVFLMVLAKYIFSRLMAMLLQTRFLPNIQYQDFIQIFIWLSFASLGLFFADLFIIKNTGFVLVNLAYLLLILVLGAFQLWLYFKFVKFYSHKKLLIISYLCTTEFLPVFLIIFWLVK